MRPTKSRFDRPTPVLLQKQTMGKKKTNEGEENKKEARKRKETHCKNTDPAKGGVQGRGTLITSPASQVRFSALRTHLTQVRNANHGWHRKGSSELLVPELTFALFLFPPPENPLPHSGFFVWKGRRIQALID